MRHAAYAPLAVCCCSPARLALLERAGAVTPSVCVCVSGGGGCVLKQRQPCPSLLLTTLGTARGRILRGSMWQAQDLGQASRQSQLHRRTCHYTRGLASPIPSYSVAPNSQGQQASTIRPSQQPLIAVLQLPCRAPAPITFTQQQSSKAPCWQLRQHQWRRRRAWAQGELACCASWPWTGTCPGRGRGREPAAGSRTAWPSHAGLCARAAPGTRAVYQPRRGLGIRPHRCAYFVLAR